MSSDTGKETVAMRAPKRTKVLLALAVVAASVVMTGSPASADPVAIELCAVTGTATLTGSTTVPIWGFGVPTTPGDCSTATASLPGPQLVVNQGDTVTIVVRNALPPATAPLHRVVFDVPGVDFNAGGNTADVDGFLTRTFTASAAGTYLYESSGDFGRQEAMGLAGALIVRPTGAPGQAYAPSSTAFDVEATLVLGAVDPAFNADPDNYDMYAYRATYWLINGKAYPDTSPITATAGQRVLLRYLNAGYDNTSMMLLGTHQHVVAKDARLLNNPYDGASETTPAGATEDAIVTVPSGGAPSANGFALFNRQLHVTNGPLTTPTPVAGGQLTFIEP
jgi:FtsP/CotA-like multicopper oxidase with cupredoxin domain